MESQKSCASCGTTVQPDAVFCPACGNRLADEDKAGKKCPGCGAAIDAGAIFCPHCGSRLDEKKPLIPVPGWLGFVHRPQLVVVLLAVALILLLLSFGTIVYLSASKSSTSSTSATSQASRKIVKTEKSAYRHGERIYVHYYSAPGLRSDWICIVPAGSPDNTVGAYQYIPSPGRGTLVFDSPGPGKYEVRAFYRYNPGHYRVTSRYRFTVGDW